MLIFLSQERFDVQTGLSFFFSFLIFFICWCQEPETWAPGTRTDQAPHMTDPQQLASLPQTDRPHPQTGLPHRQGDLEWKTVEGGGTSRQASKEKKREQGETNGKNLAGLKGRLFAALSEGGGRELPVCDSPLPLYIASKHVMSIRHVL